MSQENVAINRTKQRYPLPDQYRQLVDDQPVNEPCPEETLDRHATVDIRVLYAACLEFGHHGLRLAAKMMKGGPRGCRLQGRRAEHVNRLGSVRPRAKAKHRLIRMSAHDQGINRGHKDLVAVVDVTRVVEPVEGTVWSGDEAIQTDSDECGCSHVVRDCRLTNGAMLPPAASASASGYALRRRTARRERGCRPRSTFRSAVFTAFAVGNASATSGSRTMILDPRANRAAYLPRTPPLKSYSARIVSPAELDGFFISAPLAAAGKASADETNLSLTSLRVNDDKHPMYYRQSDQHECA